MNKYVSPLIETEENYGADVISSSGGFRIGSLDGVDEGDSKSAIFDAGFWFNN